MRTFRHWAPVRVQDNEGSGVLPLQHLSSSLDSNGLLNSTDAIRTFVFLNAQSSPPTQQVVFQLYRRGSL